MTKIITFSEICVPEHGKYRVTKNLNVGANFCPFAIILIFTGKLFHELRCLRWFVNISHLCALCYFSWMKYSTCSKILLFCRPEDSNYLPKESGGSKANTLPSVVSRIFGNMPTEYILGVEKVRLS